MYLNGKNVLYPCVTKIVWNHITDDKEKFNNIRGKFVEKKRFFNLSILIPIPRFTALLKSAALISEMNFTLDLRS